MPSSPSQSPGQKGRRICFPGKQQAILEDFELAAPQEGQVRVKTCLSMMSTGTENIIFNRLFDAGTHWDHWIKYPFYPGYIDAGWVEELGAKTSGLKIGDRVAFRAGHTSHAVIDASACYPIPEPVTFEQAVWFPLAKIGFHGAMAAHYELGDSVLVIGAGPIGQMSVRWARAAGAFAITIVDTAASRLELARAGGATLALNVSVENAREPLMQSAAGTLPRVIIDSTGNAKVFTSALGLVADRGTVVVLGDTGQPAKQSLTLDLITRGLNIVGAHDNHNTAQWHNATIARYFFSLVSSGRFDLGGLNSHTFAPEACAEAYALANRERDRTMGILFQW